MSDKENKNIENEDGNENQEHDLDSILGDDLDESDEIAEMLRNSETLRTAQPDKSENTNAAPDLDAFLDEQTEDSSDSSLDPELDDALSKFVDDGGGENSGENEEDLKKKQEEEKSAKIRKIKKVSLISVLAVFVIAAGLVTFFMVDRFTNSYVLTYETQIDGKKQSQKIDVNDFKFIMGEYSDSEDPASDAMELLKTILAIEKAASDRNLTLSAEETSNMKTDAAGWKEEVDTQTPHLSDVTRIEFVERYVTAIYLYQKLAEGILDETGWVLDEEDYALGLADFKENSKADYIEAEYKFITPETEEQAINAKAAIESGEMSVEEAFKTYYYNTDYYVSSMYGFESLESFLSESGFETIDTFLDQYGYDTVALYDLYQFKTEDINHLAALAVGEVSNVIEYYEGMFSLFVLESINIPTDEETDEIFMKVYRNSQIQNIFTPEFDKWREEFVSGVKVNQKAVDNIDINEILGT